MNGRLYNPTLGRFLSPDPYVQMPLSSQNYNRYSYCLNNPLKYTDPTGYWFGWADLAVAGAGFVFNYVAYGIKNDDWGEDALKAGAMGAVAAWVGFNTCGATSLGTYIGNMAINTAMSSIVPPMNIPVGDNFTMSVSPTFGFGTQGFTGGLGFTATYTNGDFSISGGMNGGSAGQFSMYSGVSYYDRHNDQYFSYYANYYGKDPNGHNQTVGGLGYRKGDLSLRLENDFLALNGDRWRTNAFEIGYGNFVFGSTLYTNDPKGEALARNEEIKDNIDYNGTDLRGRLNKHGNGAWKDGRVFSGPAYVGYRQGNNVTRIGYSSKWVQDLTQNFTHREGFLGILPIGYQNYYTNYDSMKEGYWGYSGYYNSYSLW